MIRLVLLAITIGISFFIFSRTFYGFLLNEQPEIIKNGHFGHSLIVEVDYSPNNFSEWLHIPPSKSILFLLSDEWISRSPEAIQQIKDQQLSTGILLSIEESPNTAIQNYEQTFEQSPLWAACTPTPCTQNQVSLLHANKINVLFTNITYKNLEQLNKLKKGDFIKLVLSSETSTKQHQIEKLFQYPFLSIEENILGFTTNTKTYP